jgi:hypothetical protein
MFGGSGLRRPAHRAAWFETAKKALARRPHLRARSPGAAVTTGPTLRRAISLFAISLPVILILLASPALSGDLVEESGFFRVVIASRTRRLELFGVEPAEGTLEGCGKETGVAARW